MPRGRIVELWLRRAVLPAAISLPLSPNRPRARVILLFPRSPFPSRALPLLACGGTGGTTLEAAAGTAAAAPSPVDRRREQEQAQPRLSPLMWTEVLILFGSSGSAKCKTLGYYP
uniref:Uncharacterized protein n=1 Tax=Oryza meridionalis TaxID=40149 RepID=A0A0E0CUN6_9ORYZ